MVSVPVFVTADTDLSALADTGDHYHLDVAATGPVTIIGHPGYDVLDASNFTYAPSGVLFTGNGSGLLFRFGLGLPDIFSNIEAIVLGRSVQLHATDRIDASATTEGLFLDAALVQPGLGADTVSGTILSYAASPSMVRVDAYADTGTGGTADGDLIYGFTEFHLSGHDDVFIGTEAEETIFGGAGNDTIRPGGSGDVIYGGDGLADVIDYSDRLDGLLIDAGFALAGADLVIDGIEGVIGGFGDDTLLAGVYIDGGGGDDVIDDGAGTSTVSGGFGNDLFGANVLSRLDHRAGDDVLYGGDGDDIFHIGPDSGNDTIFGGETGEGVGDSLIIDPLASETFQIVLDPVDGEGDAGQIDFFDALGIRVKRVLFDGIEDLPAIPSIQPELPVLPAITISGTDSADFVQGTPESNVIKGLDGNDILTGGADSDFLYGGDGVDREFGNQGADTLYGGAANDRLEGNEDADFIYGGAGDRDLAEYYYSDSGVRVDLANRLNNTGGDAEGDVLINIEDIAGSLFDDHLTGDAANNYLFGRLGHDTLDGGGGSGWMNGGAGDDHLVFRGSEAGIGGPGADTYIFHTGTYQVVGAFSIADEDKLDISHLGFATKQDFLDVGQDIAGLHTRFAVGGSHNIQLNFVTQDEISADDLIL